MGGTRQVPAPDPVAADYLRLALRLDQRLPGLVDGYFGPAALKAEVDMEQLRSPSRLRGDAIALRERVARDVADPDRRAWLDAQLVALEAHAGSLAGEPLPYMDHVARCLGFVPLRRDEAEFTAARASVDALLPGAAPLHERLEAWEGDLVIGLDRLPAVIDLLVARFRSRAEAAFGLPAGEDLRVSLVRDQPWAGYNWFDGGRRSRVDINTDLPVRAPTLISTVAHETYPGHHLEHAWKEADLVDRLARLEASALLINTPECPISEGLAELAIGFAVPLDAAVDLLLEVIELGGCAVASDPARARAAAELAVEIAPARQALGAIGGNAAYLRHVDERPHDEVVDYLREVGGHPRDVAEKRLDFIEHPLWRTYVFVYAEGEALLGRWLASVAPGQRAERFGRSLHEQLTPATILAETAVTDRG